MFKHECSRWVKTIPARGNIARNRNAHSNRHEIYFIAMEFMSDKAVFEQVEAEAGHG
jgi:hypothetical protein